MRNGVSLERLFKLWTQVARLVLSGKRCLVRVTDVLQQIIDKPDKFVFVSDLGVVVVPPNYVHATALKNFRERHSNKFHVLSEDIVDDNFKNPTDILNPGDLLLISTFGLASPGLVTSQECIDFLRARGAILVGVQGASLVWEAQREKLPKGKLCASFDVKERLFRDRFDNFVRPMLIRCSDGDDGFHLIDFEAGLTEKHCFLCFMRLKK